MSRSKRKEYTNQPQHVFGRGNFQAPIFQQEGAAEVFLKLLNECAARYVWVVYAFAIMPNHYHLVMMTPQANRTRGMQWLLSTFASRFNNYRRLHGHVFQGRYKSKVAPSGVDVSRVINYVQLNPVRAKLCTLEELIYFPWTSVTLLMHPEQRKEIKAGEALVEFGGFDDTPAGRYAHLQRLRHVHANDPDGSYFRSDWNEAEKAELEILKHAPRALQPEPSLSREEYRQREIVGWNNAASLLLERAGKNDVDVSSEIGGKPWKVAIAIELRRKTSATLPWIASRLKIGSPGYLGWLIHRHK